MVDRAKLDKGTYVEIKTSMGTLVCRLFKDKAPKTVENFINLVNGTEERAHKVKEGKFYDGIIFHRIIPDFMVQTGDPKGTGTGGPGYQFEDEFHEDLKHDKPGILSMANSGPGTNGSQFFITHVETPWLDNRHSVFGEVVDNIELIDQMGEVDTDRRDKPEVDIVMEELEIFEV